jgi:fibronectin type III domain protein
VPATIPERTQLCGKLADFFAGNPSYEVKTDKVDVTAAKATALFTAMNAANNALGPVNTDAGKKKDARDAADSALRSLMRTVINILNETLDANDPRWDTFGLNRPGSDTTPGQVTHVTAEPAGPGKLLVQWPAVSLATHYRVYLKGPNDTDFHFADDVQDTKAVLDNLTTGQTVQTQVTAANAAGEGVASEAVSGVVG